MLIPNFLQGDSSQTAWFNGVFWSFFAGWCGVYDIHTLLGLLRAPSPRWGTFSQWSPHGKFAVGIRICFLFFHTQLQLFPCYSQPRKGVVVPTSRWLNGRSLVPKTNAKANCCLRVTIATLLRVEDGGDGKVHVYPFFTNICSVNMGEHWSLMNMGEVLRQTRPHFCNTNLPSIDFWSLRLFQTSDICPPREDSFFLSSCPLTLPSYMAVQARSLSLWPLKLQAKCSKLHCTSHYTWLYPMCHVVPFESIWEVLKIISQKGFFRFMM